MQYKSIFISDVHLGTNDCKAELLNNFSEQFLTKVFNRFFDGSTQYTFFGFWSKIDIVYAPTLAPTSKTTSPSLIEIPF